MPLSVSKGLVRGPSSYEGSAITITSISIAASQLLCDIGSRLPHYATADGIFKVVLRLYNADNGEGKYASAWRNAY